MKNKFVGGKNMRKRKFFSGLGAVLIAIGVLMSSLTYSFAIENNEYIDSNAVHLDTYNLEGIKNYLQFNTKREGSSYQLVVNNDCYLYGWNSNTDVYAASRSEGSEYFDFVDTDLSDEDWISAFDNQKSNPDGYHSLFDFYVKGKAEITNNYFVNYFVGLPEDMEEFNSLGLTDEEKASYFVPALYTIIDMNDVENKRQLFKDEYDALDDETKKLYRLYVNEYYKVPKTLSYTLTSNATLLKSDYDLALDDSISCYMVYDSYKNYIGTFKLSDIAGLYTNDFSDCTAEPSITAKALVRDYDGNPYDTAYVDIQYKLGNGYDYITSVVNTETKDNLSIYGSDLNDAIRVTIYNAKNKKYKLEVTTDMGVKTTVVANVTDIGKVIDYGDDEDDDPKEPTPSEENLDAPKVTFTGTDVQTSDTYLKITMNTDIPAEMTFNGTANSGYITSSDFIVYSNGTYDYVAVGENGKKTTGKININCFKDTDVEDTDNEDKVIFYDSADEGYDSKLLPQTGITATMIIISILLVVSGIVLLVKGGKINVRKK